MNDNLQSFKKFLATNSVDIPIYGFAINILLAGFLAYLLGVLYVRYGSSLSSRKAFANNFILLTVTTMIIITVVKSSLALSLGLVGALSIVRFRSAIKEPEELTYLFVAISIGLGLGADQRLVTLVGFIGVAFFIWIKHRALNLKRDWQNIYLTVSSTDGEKPELKKISNTLNSFCSDVSIQRFDEDKDSLEATFKVEIENFEKLETCKTKILSENSNIHIAFMDNSGIIG